MSISIPGYVSNRNKSAACTFTIAHPTAHVIEIDERELS